MVIIVDYSLNNIFSVKSSLDFMNIKCRVSNNPEEISKASHIILPGVGSFGASIQKIKERISIEVLEEENVATTNELYRLENALESRIDILSSELHNTKKYYN